jgi:hypothetical protein
MATLTISLDVNSLTRDQAYTYSKLLPIQQQIEDINSSYCSLTRPVKELDWLYGEASRLTANLAFSYVFTDLDRYQLLLSAAQGYLLAQQLLSAWVS